MTTAVVVCNAVAWVLASLRWFRVAQRERYLPGAVSRFVPRWWARDARSLCLLGFAIVAALVSYRWPLAGLASGAIIALGPPGLTLRGRSSSLQWSARLFRLAAVHAAASTFLLVLGSRLFGASTATALMAIATPFLLDLALWFTARFEQRLLAAQIDLAKARLRQINPRIVAITGSYGKTTTKEHIRDLLLGTLDVVASPGNYNFHYGLTRTVLEHCTVTTEVLVAEVRAYNPGDVSEVIAWLAPTVGVFTGVGTAHLERMGSPSGIADAKSPIMDRASIAVLNADDPLVLDAVERRRSDVPRILCSGSDRQADVYVTRSGAGLDVRLEGRSIGLAPAGLFPMNVACAVGACLALEVEPSRIAAALPRLAPAAHRQTVDRSPRGIMVIDNSWSSNPAGAEAAIDRLAELSTPESRRIVVTPGIIELSDGQADANERLAAHAASIATHLLVIGTTNSDALCRGAQGAACEVISFSTHQAARDWIRNHAGSGDTVLFENDLPDHYP